MKHYKIREGTRAKQKGQRRGASGLVGLDGEKLMEVGLDGEKPGEYEHCPSCPSSMK